MPGTTVCLVAGEPAAAIVRWRSSAEARSASQRRAVAGDLVVADVLTADLALLEVADVICSRHVQPTKWHTRTLGRFPGCAVTAAPARGNGYLAAARGRRPLRLSYCEQNNPGLRVDTSDTGSVAFVCAMFVHAWLTAGWSLDAMDPACLEAVLPWAAKTIPAVPVPFVLDYEGPEPSSSSCRRMSSASGAPTPE
jgi:hypothetical protein